MTPKEARERIRSCKDMVRYYKTIIRGHERAMRGIPGIFTDSRTSLLHDLSIYKACVIRLQNRIERLELIAYPDAPYTPTGVDMEDFRVRVN